MSYVKIEGNASGTGTFTIAAPNSNTDRTLTLPDEAGTVLTSASDAVTKLNSVLMDIKLPGDQTLTDATGAIASFTSAPRVEVGGTWDTTNKRFTADASTAGYYLATFNCQFYSSTNQIYESIAYIRKNGTVVVANETTDGGSNLRHTSPSVTAIVNLASGDYLDFYVYLDVAGGTPTLSADSTATLVRLA